MLRSRRSVFPILANCVLASCLAVGWPAKAQVYYPNRETRISNLPKLIAPSSDASAVLRTSLEIILQDKEVCCGKNSALDDSLQSVDPDSMKDLAGKLQGRHLLSDGRPIKVTVEYVESSALNAGRLIAMLNQKHAGLVLWDSHFYVVYGATYIESMRHYEGPVAYSIRTLRLLDSRFSDTRREVVFNRETDDLSKIQGILLLMAEPQ
jgi:hypothetical protein